jgi:hypothetical protein
MKECLDKYVSEGRTCPCHPLESALALEILKKAVDALVVKMLKQLARELLDDQLVLGEEIITQR